mgnify:CR=1 FL=1
MGAAAQAVEREVAAFERLAARRGLRHSRPRRDIVRAFLGAGRHLTAEELWDRVRRTNPRVGVATVYRTLKVMAETGFCRELRIENGAVRYEQGAGLDHHDHLICTRCGRLEEVVDPAIERLQERLCARLGFVADHHRLDIYGWCQACARGRGGAVRRPDTKGAAR